MHLSNHKLSAGAIGAPGSHRRTLRSADSSSSLTELGELAERHIYLYLHDRCPPSAVGDHGIGLPETDLAHLFERGYRGSNVTDRIGGTGLGLAASRLIVDLHGGTLELDGRLDEGSTVTLRLPI